MPLRDQHGRVLRWLGTNIDIDDQKQIEETLRQERELLQTLIDTVPVMLTLYKPGTEVLQLNREFEKLIGWSTQEAAGVSLMEQCYPDPDERERIRQFMETCRPGWMDIRMRTREGRILDTVWANVRLTTGIQVGIGIDVTARKAAEAEREQLLAELQRVNAELRQFAYIVSHDLNEPLRTMRSFVQLLTQRYQGRLDATGNEYLAFVVDGARRMQQMLTDLLAYTRAGQRLEFQTANCEAVLGQVLSALQTRVVECGAVITHDSLPAVHGDATRLGHVFQNLISNSLKFRGEAPPRIHVSVRRADGQWQFAVRDNGIGIDPRHAERIFQIFQRLHTRSEYPGTGIGLAICKKIVEQHGGRIWVESRPGEGAIFYFTISDIERGEKRQ